MAGTTAGYNYTQAGPYKGLMGGDWNNLQSSLQRPGEIAANQAYQRGGANLSRTFGANGLYGSSMHARQAQDMTQQYADTMATNAANAASQRYNLENQDYQNQNNYGLKTAALDNANEQFYNKLVQDKDLAQKEMYLRMAQLANQNNNNSGNSGGGFNWGGLAQGIGTLGGGLLSQFNLF